MKIINIEVNKIKPNPFKKFINSGKLDNDTIEMLIEGYKQTIFHENLCARENKHKELELVYGHHRIEAVKRLYGKNYKISIKVYSQDEFSDEAMLIDMIRENLTQRSRGQDYTDISDSILLVKRWLQGEFNSKSQEIRPYKYSVTAKQIADFISKNSRAISEEQIEKHLNIGENLSEELRQQIENNGKVKRNELGFEIAADLSKINKKEQVEVHKEIKRLGFNRDKARHLISKYKSASEKNKQKLQKGEIGLDEIETEQLKEEIEEAQKKTDKKEDKMLQIRKIKELQKEAENQIGETNEQIFKACNLLAILHKQGVLQSLNPESVEKIVQAGEIGGKKYTKFMELLQNKL
jgi:hypothetical protein